MSDIFDRAVLGYIAYNSHEIRKETSRQTVFAQAQLELEQLRANKEDEQQYLRDNIFKVHTLLVDHLPQLTPQQGLYWLAFFTNRLLLENVTADRFSSIADKKEGGEILREFKSTCDTYVDRVAKAEGDMIINSARLVYALPILGQLANLVAIRDALPTSMGLRIRRIKARAIGYGVGVIAGAVIFPAFMSGPFLARVGGGGVLGLITFGGGLIYFCEPRLHKRFLPTNWDQLVTLADENGVNLGLNSTQEDLAGIISQVEANLPAVSEQRDANPSNYQARYEAALTFLKNTQTRFAIE